MYRGNEMADSLCYVHKWNREATQAVSSKNQTECLHLFLFIAQPRQEGNNRVIRLPKGRKVMLTSGLLIPSIIPASGFKLLVNGVVLLMFPIVVSCPQRCILFKQETWPLSTEVNTTGDEPPAGSSLLQPLRPWLSCHMSQRDKQSCEKKKLTLASIRTTHSFNRILIKASAPRSLPGYCETFFFFSVILNISLFLPFKKFSFLIFMCCLLTKHGNMHMECRLYISNISSLQGWGKN